MNLPVEVIEAARQGRALLFLGARTTLEAVELSGKDPVEPKALAKDLGWTPPREASRTRPPLPSVFDGAAVYEARHGRARLVAHLHERTCPTGTVSSAAHRLAASRFSLVFTTCRDDLLEAAADAQGVPLTVLGRQDALLTEPARAFVVHLHGCFSDPSSLVLTRDDLTRSPLGAEIKKQIRQLLRTRVVLFVGFRPDDEELELVWAELTACYGGELPRCHLAVAQGRIDDFLWQKWVWRGLLLFTADPSECLVALDRQLDAAA